MTKFEKETKEIFQIKGKNILIKNQNFKRKLSLKNEKIIFLLSP